MTNVLIVGAPVGWATNRLRLSDFIPTVRSLPSFRFLARSMLL